ncbi:MAG: DUF4159 domain-containing protein [Planctomycetes bacterium]|nr:DUF4159 domain-containing protein [Planctomycetota bacterium]
MGNVRKGLHGFLLAALILFSPPLWASGWEGISVLAPLRFTRLQHSGEGWDEGRGPGGDGGMLRELKKASGLEVAGEAGSITLWELVHLREGYAPPFVFITGRSFSLLPGDMSQLNEYCLKDGGLILAIDGGGDFDRSFREVMSFTFQKGGWVGVPGSDPLFTTPHKLLPSRAEVKARLPRIQGIKEGGRWIALYLREMPPGSPWAASGDSAKKPPEETSLLLLNILHYAFSGYAERYGKYHRSVVKSSAPVARKPMQEEIIQGYPANSGFESLDDESDDPLILEHPPETLLKPEVKEKSRSILDVEDSL